MIHEVIRSLECIAPVPRGAGDKHDGIARQHHAHPVNDQSGQKRPAPFSLDDKLLHPRKGQRLEMAQFQCLDRIAFFLPDLSQETYDTARRLLPIAETRQFGRRVEWVAGKDDATHLSPH